jgi:molecular chaperone GrpE
MASRSSTPWERFDPNLHEAIFEVSDPSVPNGTVTEVVEIGYWIASRALRPAKIGLVSGGAKAGRRQGLAARRGSD